MAQTNDLPISKPFRPWFFAIAMNRCRADFRRAKVVGVSMDKLIENSVVGYTTPVDIAVSTETSQLVQSAVAALPVQQRHVAVDLPAELFGTVNVSPAIAYEYYDPTIRGIGESIHLVVTGDTTER